MVTIINIRKQGSSPDATYFYCGRGSKLGNPYRLNSPSERDYVCDKYEEYFNANKTNYGIEQQLQEIYKASLNGNVELGCFCAPKRCHCETIKNYIDKRISDENTSNSNSST